MSLKLSKEAREYVEQFIYSQDNWKEWLQSELESIGVACYEDEDVDDWVQSYIDSVEAGDFEVKFTITEAKSLGNRTYKAWLDIDEIWVPKDSTDDKDSNV